MVTIRYENTTNFAAYPFELGIRHLKVAFCEGSQKNLTEMAKEKIIYRPSAQNNNVYEPLSFGDRFKHFAIGLGETLGYITIIIPYIIAAVDKFFNKPFYPKGTDRIRTHMEEGGSRNDAYDDWRKNPFHDDAINDPFYQVAPLLPEQPIANREFILINDRAVSLESLFAQAKTYAKEHFLMSPWVSSKEEASDSLLNFINDILNDQLFQKNPKSYLEGWRIERTTSDAKVRIPIDQAQSFFENLFLVTTAS